ncbi:MAG: C39 family peptidase [Lachnospira sp.]|nr:C39 family peptidase [Lachnospira sp.]
MARIRVRKKRKRGKLFLMGMLLLILLFLGGQVLSGLADMYRMHKAKAGGEGGVSAGGTSSTSFWQKKEQNKRPSWLTDEYPDELIELYERNPETKSFVKNYFKEKDIKHKIDISQEVGAGYYPYFYQWDKRWGYETYGDDMIALTGCGPVCLSMVLCKLRSDSQYDPLTVANMADNNGYYVAGSGSSWSLMDEGAALYGLNSYAVPFNENGIREELLNGHPIICVVGPGTFTTTGHFIVICGIADDGNMIIRDPNSKEKSNMTWPLSELMGQIQNLWSYSL